MRQPISGRTQHHPASSLDECPGVRTCKPPRQLAKRVILPKSVCGSKLVRISSGVTLGAVRIIRIIVPDARSGDCRSTKVSLGISSSLARARGI